MGTPRRTLTAPCAWVWCCAADKECKDHDYCAFCNLYCASPCKLEFTRAAKCIEVLPSDPKWIRDSVCQEWWMNLMVCEMNNKDYFAEVARSLKAEADAEKAKARNKASTEDAAEEATLESEG
jgi:hypothetical protein